MSAMKNGGNRFLFNVGRYRTTSRHIPEDCKLDAVKPLCVTAMTMLLYFVLNGHFETHGKILQNMDTFEYKQISLIVIRT